MAADPMPPPPLTRSSPPCGGGAEEAAGVPQKSGSQDSQARAEAKTIRGCESNDVFGESGGMTLKPEKC